MNFEDIQISVDKLEIRLLPVKCPVGRGYFPRAYYDGVLRVVWLSGDSEYFAFFSPTGKDSEDKYKYTVLPIPAWKYHDLGIDRKTIPGSLLQEIRDKGQILETYLEERVDPYEEDNLG